MKREITKLLGAPLDRHSAMTPAVRVLFVGGPLHGQTEVRTFLATEIEVPVYFTTGGKVSSISDSFHHDLTDPVDFHKTLTVHYVYGEMAGVSVYTYSLPPGEDNFEWSFRDAVIRASGLLEDIVVNIPSLDDISVASVDNVPFKRKDYPVEASFVEPAV